MMNNTRYYELLSINKDANESEIKKAYKKCALKYHPDRNPNDKEESERKFKEISEAYSILSDSKKKNIYDNYGEEAVKNSGQPSGSPFDIFEQMFGASAGFSNMGEGIFGGGSPFSDTPFGQFFGNRNTQSQNKITKMKVKITYKDIILGLKKKIKINRKILKSENDIKICSQCKGKGKIANLIRLGPGIVTQSISPCSKCNQTGKIYKHTIIEESIEIQIPKGSKDGDHIKITGKGNDINLNEKSDLVIFFEEETLEDMIRKDSDLLYTKDILLSEALCGFSFILNHPAKNNILISSSSIIEPKSTKIVSGLGFPYKNSVKQGNLIINFNIIFPKEISTEKKQLISKLLPIKNKSNSSNNNLEEFFLNDFNSNFYQEDNSNSYSNEQEGVECQTQ